MSKTPAPGPYEIVPVDEAASSAGENWVTIRNEQGAIATVYPAKNAQATGRLLAAAPELLEAAQLLRNDASLPNWARLTQAIAKAEGE